jgi:2-dehydropantoate 2-reductase
MTPTSSAPKTLRILLVGAGSVGQVYGRHFQLGGAEVRFLVRPKYLDTCRQGFTLHRFQHRRVDSSRFVPDRVSATAAEAAEGGVDLVVLCMSYAGLHGDWLPELLEHTGEAAVLSLVPSIAAREWLAERIPAPRLLVGFITLMAYPAPLSGQNLEPGTGYWFPPLAPAPIEGPTDHVAVIVSCLRAGGQPVRAAANNSRQSAAATALFMPMIAGLELAGWSFAGLKRRKDLARVCQAGCEASELAALRLGVPPPFARWLLRPMLVRCMLATAPLLVPFNLEGFLALHFDKVSAQTRLFLNDWLATAESEKRAAPALRELATDLARLDAS